MTNKTENETQEQQETPKIRKVSTGAWWKSFKKKKVEKNDRGNDQVKPIKVEPVKAKQVEVKSAEPKPIKAKPVKAKPVAPKKPRPAKAKKTDHPDKTEKS